MYRFNQKSFADKNKDKIELIKQFGKHTLLLYADLESMQIIEDSNIVALAQKYGVDSGKLMQFLKSRNIIVEVTTDTKPPEAKPQDNTIQERPQETIQPEPPPKPSIDVNELTPAERNVYNKYGENGVKVLRVYDPKKSFLQISEESGVSIDSVVEICDYIRSADLVSTPETAQTNRFTPKIVTDIDEIENEATDIDEFEINKDQKDPLKKYVIKYKLPLHIAAKFGQDGKIVEKYIDQNPKFRIVDALIALKMPMNRFLDIIQFISKEYGIVKTRKITRKELRSAYGYDSYAVYKKHGIHGLILYNLLGGDIGVEESIRQYVRISGDRDPQKIASIINSINEVLGVRAVIDESAVERALK
ncbi:MAG: hypothetical protein NZ908_02270 [Candidatus Micrarchaeota archaeon]|nr:hypothetical protein [Candidatus Micrarchaeota archaeon]